MASLTDNMCVLHKVLLIPDDVILSSMADIDCYILGKCINETIDEILDYFTECINNAAGTNIDCTIICEQFKNIVILNTESDSHFMHSLIGKLTCKHIILLDSIFKYLENTDELIVLYMNTLSVYPFQDRRDIMQVITHSEYFVKYLMSSSTHKCSGRVEEMAGLLSYFILNCNGIETLKEIYIDIASIKTSIDNFMKYCPDRFIEYINKVCHTNDIYTKATPEAFEIKKASSINFMYAISKICLYINNIHGKQCIASDYNIKDTDTLEAKIAKTTLYTIRLSYISINTIIKALNKYIEVLMPITFTFFGNYSENVERCQKLKTKINVLKTVYNDCDYNAMIDAFFVDTITALNKSDIYCGDAFINDFIDILNINHNQIPHDVITYFFKLGIASVYCNKHVRYTIFTYVFNYCETNGFYNLVKLGDNILSDGLNAILKFVAEIDYFEIDTPPQVYVFHQNLLDYINYMISKIDKVHNTATCDVAFYKLVSKANDFIFDIIKLCDKIDETIKSEDLDATQYDDIQYDYRHIIICYFRNCMTSISAMIKMMATDIFTNYKYSDEFIISLTNFITSSVSFLADSNKLILSDVFHLNAETRELINELYKLLNVSLSNPQFLENIMDKLDMLINTGTKRNIDNKIIQKIILIKKENCKNIDIDNIDFPDEFIDPFTCTLIKTPVLIPNCSQFFDKSSIMAHLRNIETNPITSEYLNIKDFTDYNETPNVKLLIEDFNKRKSNIINIGNNE